MSVPNGTLLYRVGEAEREIRELWATKPEVVAEQVRVLSADVKSLRRGFYTFAFTAAGSAIVFALSVFALLAKHG